jgi:hypothetical protein
VTYQGKTFNITIHQEMQINSTMRYYLTSIRMVITKKKAKDREYWQECGEKEACPLMMAM